MLQSTTTSLVALTAGALISGTVSAQIFSPTQAQLFDVVDVTADFGGGGGLYTGSGTAFGLNGDGVDYDLDLLPGGDGISRAVIKNSNFTMDLSGFTSFDIGFVGEQPFSAKTYLLTGPGEDFFESPLTQFSPNAEGRVDLPLDGITNLDDIRGFGIQFFNPGNGSAFGRVVHATTVGDPPVFDSEQLFSFETGFENWGGSFQDQTSHSLNTNPAFASDGSQSLQITRAHTGTNFKWGTEFYLNAGSDPLDSNIVSPDPDSGRGVTNATQTEVDDFAAKFETADILAVDVVVDPTLLDPSLTFLNLDLFLNDASGAFWGFPGGGQPLDVTEAGTVTLEYQLDTLIANGTGADPDNPNFGGFTDGTDHVRIGFATNMDAAGAFYLDNIRLLTEVTGNGLSADFNQDGTVDLLDLDILGQNWQMVGDMTMGDANGDGVINLLDLDILGQEWQMSASFAEALAESGIAVPEPAGLTALALMAVGMRRRRSVVSI